MALGHRWRQLTLTLREHTVEGRKKGFYRKKSSRPVDWWGYDQAQMHEACDVLESIQVGVDQVSLDLGKYLARGSRGRGPGRPRRSDAGDLAKALLLQQ